MLERLLRDIPCIDALTAFQPISGAPDCPLVLEVLAIPHQFRCGRTLAELTARALQDGTTPPQAAWALSVGDGEELAGTLHEALVAAGFRALHLSSDPARPRYFCNDCSDDVVISANGALRELLAADVAEGDEESEHDS